MDRKKRRWMLFLAILYACAMLYLLLCRDPAVTDTPYRQQLPHHLNLHPFHTIRRFLWVFSHSSNAWLLRQASINIYGNILLFLPLGFFPPVLWERMQKLWKTVLLAAGIIVCIELLQMLLLVGTCDVDDIILNVIGAAIGYGIFKLTRHTPATE